MTKTTPADRGEVILYRTEDGRTALDVRLAGETVWLTQAQMAELFGRERSVITKNTISAGTRAADRRVSSRIMEDRA